MIHDLETIKQVFDKYGVRIIIVYGALLGYYRDKKPLPGDDDIDIAVIDKPSLQVRKAIGWALYDLGFIPQQIGFNVFGRIEPQELGYNGTEETGIITCQRNFKFTLLFFKEEQCDKHGREYVCIPKLGALRLISTPAKFFDKLDMIKIRGKKYLTPSPIEDYLEFSYENWKDPNKRDHSPTYFIMHNITPEFLDIEGKNEAVIYRSPLGS